MRQLLPPETSGADPFAAYSAVDRRGPPDRPWVMLNFVASADGSATVEGRSGPLGGPADRTLFHRLRTVADLVLVGAGTVRAERYGPVRGADPAPLAVVTASLELDWQGRLFTEAAARPLVITCEAADPAHRERASSVAEVLVTGDRRVDLDEAVAALGRRGHRVVLCEGGPTLAAELVRLELVDELCLTVAPLLVAGQGPRILDDAVPLPDRAEAGPTRMALDSVIEDEGSLFLRYVRP